VRHKKKKERPPPELSSAYLHEQARRHLQRYWPSEFQLRRVLGRRVQRCLYFHGGEREDADVLVDGVIAELVQSGGLDDRRFTQHWVEEMHGRGISALGIRARMRDKGVGRELVDDALRELQGPDPELARACTYVRRRRLGPERRDPSQRKDRREKDLGAMARAGFAWSIAKRVIDADDLELLLDEDG
jgi:regulatory protein